MQGRPDCFDFSPPVPYEEETSTNGHFTFRVRSLAPKESFTLQLLSYTKLPNVLNIRSKAGNAERLPFHIQRIFPSWINLLAVYLMVTGLGLTFYWLLRVGRDIWSRM